MKFCPHCGGDIASYLGVSPGLATPTAAPVPVPAGPYDQAKVWRALIERAHTIENEPPDISALAFDLAVQIKGMPVPETGLKTVIHIVFDRKVVPDGGALYMTAMSNGSLGPQDMNYFRARGYLVEDEKVRVANDVPIGPAYGAVDYWGGDKQHRRWHMAAPVKLNASRNGDPYFMDENMMAFGVTWKDTTKVDEAFLELFGALRSGVKGGGAIAHPLVVRAIRA